MANDIISTVKVIGTILIQNEDSSLIRLKNVRYLTTMSKNLISLGTLEDQGCCFQSKDRVLKVFKGCRTLIKAQKERILYLLKGKAIPGEANVVDRGQDETKL